MAKMIADKYSQEEKEKDKALIDKILSDGRTDN